MNKEDLFRKLIEKGILIRSGSDKEDNTYRVFKFQDKKFRLTLTIEGGENE